jgi:hypothetical protein
MGAAFSHRCLLRVALVAGCLSGGLLAPASSYAFPPLNLGPPTISGTAQVGQTLTENHGSWIGGPVGYSYQWMRCTGLSCAAIPQATGRSYAPVAEDVAHKLKVAETASNFNGFSAPAESSSTSAVLPMVPELILPPHITGIVRPGQTLTVVPGAWTSEPTGFSYQWLLCNSAGTNCTPIPGATGITYVTLAEDVGHKLRVTETASNAGGSAGPAEAAATPLALSLPPESTSPTVVQAVAMAVASSVTNALSSLQVLPARLVLSVKSVTIEKHGIAPVPVLCPVSASTGCRGTLTIRLVEAPPKGTRVVAARCGRGCRPLGGAKYEAHAGQRLTVRVHIASYGHGLFKKREVLRVTLTALTVAGGQTATSVDTISLKAPPRA